MGEPVRILDLAENVIRLSGLTPYEDIDIAVTGLRPGEKIHEELSYEGEGLEKTPHEKIFLGTAMEPSEAVSAVLTGGGVALEIEIDALSGMDDEEVKSWIKRYLPSYLPAEDRRN
jgi:FlaA1/EpsC-like NDP-sugar epimerase